jgi:TATA-box binding protein (TBP) (component of TFIID and TFIIIB)
MANIKNVVATGKFGCCLSLKEIYASNLMVQYDPRRFSGLLIRKLKPFKSHCQLYSNGKFTVNGGHSEEEALLLAESYGRTLRKLGYKSASVTSFKVVNIVACADFRKRINFQRLLYDLRCFRPKYEPELFPGLSVRMSDSTCVIFRSGKMNILGAKTAQDIEATLVELQLFTNLCL